MHSYSLSHLWHLRSNSEATMFMKFEVNLQIVYMCKNHGGEIIICVCVSVYLILCFPQNVVYYTHFVPGTWKAWPIRLTRNLGNLQSPTEGMPDNLGDISAIKESCPVFCVSGCTDALLMAVSACVCMRVCTHNVQYLLSRCLLYVWRQIKIFIDRIYILDSRSDILQVVLKFRWWMTASNTTHICVYI